jgi:hypothetical protein
MHEQIKPVSSEDLEAIQDTRYALHALGLLTRIRREECTLNEAFNDALAESNEKEYQDALRAAKEFLKEHAERFGLGIEKPR